MQYPRDKTLVYRVVVDFSGERKEYIRPMIAIDSTEIAVHIWADGPTVRPTVTVPLSYAMIEWRDDPPEPVQENPLPMT